MAPSEPTCYKSGHLSNRDSNQCKMESKLTGDLIASSVYVKSSPFTCSSSGHVVSSSSSQTNGILAPKKMVGKVKKVASKTLQHLADNMIGMSTSRRGSNESMTMSNSNHDNNNNNKNGKSCFYGSKSGMSTSSSRSLSMADTSLNSSSLRSEEDHQVGTAGHDDLDNNSIHASGGGSSIFHSGEFLRDNTKSNDRNVKVTPTTSTATATAEVKKQEHPHSRFVGSSVRTVKKLAKAGTKMAQSGTKKAVEVASAPLRRYNSSRSFKDRNEEKSGCEEQSQHHQEGDPFSSMKPVVTVASNAPSSLGTMSDEEFIPPPPMASSSSSTPIHKNHKESKEGAAATRSMQKTAEVSSGLPGSSRNEDGHADDSSNGMNGVVSASSSPRIGTSVPMNPGGNMTISSSHQGPLVITIPKPGRMSARQLSAVLEGTEDDDAHPHATASRKTPRVPPGACVTGSPSCHNIDLGDLSRDSIDESSHTNSNSSSGKTSASGRRRSSGTRRSLTRSTKVGSVDGHGSFTSPTPSVHSYSDNSSGNNGRTNGSFARSSITSERSSIASMPSLTSIQDSTHHGDFESDDEQWQRESPLLVPQSNDNLIPSLSLAGDNGAACRHSPFRPDHQTAGVTLDILSPMFSAVRKKRHGWDEGCARHPSSNKGVDAVPCNIARRPSDQSDSAKDAATAAAFLQELTHQSQCKDVSPIWPPQVQLAPLTVQRQAVEIPAELREMSEELIATDQCCFPECLEETRGVVGVTRTEFLPESPASTPGDVEGGLPAASDDGLCRVGAAENMRRSSLDVKMHNNISVPADEALFGPNSANHRALLKRVDEGKADTVPRPAQRRTSDTTALHDIIQT